MEYKNEDLGVSFRVPDRVTVRQQMTYYSQAATGGSDFFLRYWYGARAIVENWQYEKMPDIMTDLDTLTDPAVSNVLIWASMRVKEYIEGLEDVPKNS